MDSITTSKRLIHNTIFNVVGYIVCAAIALFMVPFLIKSLGSKIYGVWILIGSVFGYATIFQMGLSSAINRYVPVFLARSDMAGVRRTVSTATFFFSVIAVVLLMAIVVLYQNLATWFSNSIPTDLVGTAQILVLVVGLCFVCVMPLQPYAAVISGLQRYDIHSLSRIAPVVLRAAILIVLLSSGHGVTTVALVYGLCELVTRIFLVICSRILLKDTLLFLSEIDFKLLKEMLSYGINTFLYAMGAVIIYKASDIIIGIFLTAEHITQFSISTAPLMVLSMLLQTFVAATKPAVSDLDARNDDSKIRQIAFLTQKYSLILLIPSCSFLLVMGREILSIWVGREFGQLHLILAVLTVGHFLRLAQHSNYVVLVGKGQHRIFGILTVIMAFCSVVLAIISIKVFDLGLMGIALSNFIPVTFVSGVILPAYFNRKMKISFKDSIEHVWLPALLGSLPSVVLMLFWKCFFPPADWVGILVVVLFAALLTAVGSWVLAFSKAERQRFMMILAPGGSRK